MNQLSSGELSNLVGYRVINDTVAESEFQRHFNYLSNILLPRATSEDRSRLCPGIRASSG